MRYIFPSEIKGAFCVICKIHDNGGRPFKVIITKMSECYKVDIKKNISEFSSGSRFGDIILSFSTREIFMGESFKNDMTEYSCGYGPSFDGNSILIKPLEDGSHSEPDYPHGEPDSNRYVYIGSEIYSFISKSPIDFYISPVGNNDVPYPVARDTQNNFYLLCENIAVYKPKNSSLWNYDPDEIYTTYYNNRVIGTRLSVEWLNTGRLSELSISTR